MRIAVTYALRLRPRDEINIVVVLA
jgi:hypothetical protein